MGTFPAGPMFIALPIAGELLRKKASIDNILVFLGVWASLKIPQLGVEIQFLGLKFTFIRFILTLVSVNLIALIIKLKWIPKPEGMTMTKLLGIGFLASIGFTMSLFVTELAFDENKHPEFPDQAKLGIIFASVTGGLIGYFILSRSKK